MRRATGHGARTPGSSPAFVRWLGEAGYGPADGRVGALDLLVRSGLPAPEGFVLTAEGHREFLRTLSRNRGLGERLEREVRAALLELGARTVVVNWSCESRRGLGTIPAVVAAVREAWTPAPADGAFPTRPVLVQRQAQPVYTGWTTTADLGGARPVPDAPLHDLEPAPGLGEEGLGCLTGRAAAALGGVVRLRWGLEDGRWLLVAVEEAPG